MVDCKYSLDEAMLLLVSMSKEGIQLGTVTGGFASVKTTPPPRLALIVRMQEGKWRHFLEKQEKTYFKWSIRQGAVSTFLPGVFSMALC